MKFSHIALAIAAMTVSATAQAQIVNIAAVDPSKADYAASPVTMNFNPGTYTAQVVGIAGGGTYDAWGVATPAAGNFDERYNISYNGTTTAVNPYAGQRFATATDALDAFSGILTSFTIAAATDVTFSIPDNWWYDNTGGVSLKISPVGSGAPTPVPEPATMGLFALGGAALLARGRRKAKRAAAI